MVNKKHLYKKDRQLLATLVNIFGLQEKYADYKSVTGFPFMVNTLIESIDYAAVFVRNDEFMNELKHLRDKLKS